MAGVKPSAAQHCNAPELDPLIARAAGLKAPVLQHTWLKITNLLSPPAAPTRPANPFGPPAGRRG
jgi:hypothetical protein